MGITALMGTPGIYPENLRGSHPKKKNNQDEIKILLIKIMSEFINIKIIKNEIF